MLALGHVRLGTLIDVLRNDLDCETRKANDLVYSEAEDRWYQPEWLVCDDRYLPLPQPCDADEVVGPGYIRLVEERLGVEVPKSILASFDGAGTHCDGYSMQRLPCITAATGGRSATWARQARDGTDVRPRRSPSVVPTA